MLAGNNLKLRSAFFHTESQQFSPYAKHFALDKNDYDLRGIQPSILHSVNAYAHERGRVRSKGKEKA
jgi:hypothetical protein